MDVQDFSFEHVLERLVDQRGSRDPRARRVASVAKALVEVGERRGGGHDDAPSSCSPAQLYAQGMTALEGTILRKAVDKNEVNESLGTQVAMLEVLSQVVPYVEPTQIVVATLPVPSRVLRSLVSFCQSIDTAFDTEDELGGVTAVLRSTAKTCGRIAIKLHGTKPDTKVLQHFWKGILLALVTDIRDKVRKAAVNSILEVLANEEKCMPEFRSMTTTFASNTLRHTRKQVQGDSTKEIATILPVVAFLERSVVFLRKEKVLVDVMELLTALLQAETEAVTGATATTVTTDFVALTKQKKRTDGGIPILIINALLGVLKVALEDAESERGMSDIASRVVASLLTAQPMWIFRNGMTDADILRVGRTVWGQVLILGSRRIVKDETKLEVACKILPVLVRMVLLLAKPVDETDEEEASVAFQLFVDLTQFFRENLPSLQSKQALAPIRAITVSFEQVLQPIYRPTWAVSLKCFSVCLQYAEDMSYSSEKVETLIGLRGDNSASSTARNAIEDAISTLVQGAGLDKVWSWVAWPNSPSTARERGWLLGVLKTAAQVAQPLPLQISFFQSEILALARRFDRIAATGAGKHKLENHTGVIDTWKLLLCFLQQMPPDISDSLPSLTTTMVKVLEDERYPELTPVICHAISMLAQRGEETRELYGEILEETSAKLLPVLFRISMSLTGDSSEPTDMQLENTESEVNERTEKGQKLQVLGDAVCSLCRIANRSFLQGLFKKLMHRLLKELQQDPSSEMKLCGYLSLSQSLAKSGALDEDNIGFLFRVTKPLLRDGQHGPKSLKRAYKLLAEICEQYSSFFTEPARLVALSSLLKETSGSSQVVARYMRLKCISRVVEGLDADSASSTVLDKILSFTSEMLLCLKDSNGKTRDAAYELLLNIAAKSQYETILRVLTASLASETTHVRSASVMALSRVVYELVGEKEEVQASLPSLLRIVLCLLAEESREVIKSVVGFVRVCVTAIPKDHLERLLPELVGSLMKYHKVKERFRNKIKIILKKLVKRYGYDGLMPHVPPSETRLLTHMRKVDERMKRRKSSQQISDAATKSGFDEFLDSDEEDSDNGRTLVTTVAGDTLTRASRKSKRTRATSLIRQSRKVESAIQLPSEADGNIVDMLGSTISKRVSFMDQNDQEDSSDDDVVEFNDDGMLIVRECTGANEDDIGAEGSQKKRKLSKFDSVRDSRAGDNPKRHKNKSGDLGLAFKSKKAGGDVKRKDQKYEPYAFVPLNAKAYSKKNRKNAVESMSSVVRKGKKQK